MTRLVALLILALAACRPPSPSALTSEHATAIRDSVSAFLDGLAADISNPPIGSNARQALAPFYDPEVVMSTDLAPEEPVLIQTFDSLVPASEKVTQPGWIKDTKFEWGHRVIRAIGPGLATFTAKYAERVTDTSGTEHLLPGVQHGLVVHRAEGWRLLAIQSAHPPLTHQRHQALQAR